MKEKFNMVMSKSLPRLDLNSSAKKSFKKDTSSVYFGSPAK